VTLPLGIERDRGQSHEYPRAAIVPKEGWNTWGLRGIIAGETCSLMVHIQIRVLGARRWIGWDIKIFAVISI